jgi:hypothetical protein
VVVESRSPLAQPPGPPERPPFLVALHGVDEGGWDSVRVVPGSEANIQFSAYSVITGTNATMALADVAHFRVEVSGPDGRLVSILSASVPEVAVTRGAMEALVELWAQASPPGMPDDVRESFGARMLNQPHAPFLPAIRDIFVDADERIWVERFDVPGSGPSRWEVFEREGTWIGRVQMPEGLARGWSGAGSKPGFSVASGRLAGVWTDPDTGVETVRVYRVIEPDS